MAVAKNSPDKLYSRNKGLLSMSQSDLHDFTSTSEAKLPYSSSKKKKGLQNLSNG